MVSLALAVALILFGGACSSGSTSSASTTSEAPEPRGYQPTPVRVTGDLVLPDYAANPAGADFALKASPGDLLVIFFGFLSCPDICPVTMADIAAGLEEVGPETADRIEIAFATVDIERDTGPGIVEYLNNFFPASTLRALRANDAVQLNEVTREVGVQWMVDPHEPGASSYGVAHSGSTYVIDDNGRVVWEWPFGTAGPQVAATLHQLMDTVYSKS
ncbi:MAG: SCO family protein [Acidimicrobiales bacterium]